MKTKFILAASLLFAVSLTQALADSWIGSAVNVNGTWYTTKTLGWNPAPESFDGKNLGEISALYLGGLSLVYPETNDTQAETMTMGYKIDGVQQPDITLTFFEYEGNNRKYQSGGSSFVDYLIDISDLSEEVEHTIEVWFVCNIKNYGNNYDLWDSNGGNNFKATFKKKAPTPLANSSDIATVMEAAEGNPVDVQLNGLTLYKDTYWNTLCLPFSLTTVEIETSPLAGAVINGLTESTLDDEGTLTLNFNAVTSITAGTPYIIKWTSEEDAVVNPIFTGVTLSTSKAGFVEGDFMFVGNFDPETSIDGQDFLYLGAENTLYYPEEPVSIGAFRAFFGTTLDTSGEAKAFVLNFDDDNETTSIKQISNVSTLSNLYFTLDGRRINGKPATAGLYIHNGKKVVIK